MSEVDTVWTWGGLTSTPPIIKYLIRKGGRHGIRTRFHRAIVESHIRCTPTSYDSQYIEYSIIYHKKLKFSTQRSKKTRDFGKKISKQNFAKIA